MMNLRLIFFLTLLTSVFGQTNAEEKTGVYGEVKEKKVKAEDGSDETLAKLLTVEGVNGKYETCKKDPSKKLADMPGCIWDALSDDQRKKVQAMYAQEAKPDNSGRTPASTEAPKTSGLTNKSKQIAEDYMSDPAVVELSKVMQKKLEEALLGTKEEQKDTSKIASVNHANFIELYQTELGKTIVNAFTSYCIEADFGLKAYIKETVKECKNEKNEKIPCVLTILSSEADKATTIKDNIKSLKVANLTSSTEAVENEHSRKWTNCIASVGNVCYTNKNDFAGVTVSNQDVSDSIDRSKTKACIIMDYVKSARKNLMIAGEQEKFFATYNSKKINSLEIGNARVVAETESNTMDAVATITSKDIEGSKDFESSYQKKNEDLQKEMDKCMGKDEQIINPEACKKFLSTETDAKEESLAEFGMRQYALGAQIDEKFKNGDGDEVKKYLKEEGYEQSKIDQMLSNPTELEKVKKEIIDRYKSERDAIIASMAKKIESQTSTTDGLIDPNKDQSKIQKIRTELLSRADDLKQLVHFNNVVSSYLVIGKEKNRNVASLFAEIDGGAESFRDIDKEQLTEIEKNASKAGLKAKKDRTRTNFGIDTLNDLFRYSTEK